jgi:hypothetical protein
MRNKRKIQHKRAPGISSLISVCQIESRSCSRPSSLYKFTKSLSDAVIEFLTALGQDVQITVKPTRKG